MMMRVLAALLMPPIRLITYRELETCNQPVDGYSPAPTGLLEIGRVQYMDPLWLRQQFEDNCLVKIFFEGLPYLPAADGFFKEPAYTIVFMHRNEEEIKQSVARAEKYLKDLETLAKEERPSPKDRHNMGFDLYKEYNRQDINHVLSICEARRDIKIIEVQFEDFIKDTRKELLKISERLPLMVTKEKFELAMKQVHPEFHRIKCA
jgi:hypothetical protein